MEGRLYSTVGSLMRGGIGGAAARMLAFGVSCVAGDIRVRRHSLPATGHAGSRWGGVLDQNQSKGASLLFLDACAHARTGVCGHLFWRELCTRAHAHTSGVRSQPK